MEADDFDALPDDEARTLVSGCLGVQRWVDELVAGRPYADTAALMEQAHDSAIDLTDDELASALSCHPRIGERRDGDGAESRLSRSEQAGVTANDADQLRTANAAYEDRFGHVFLIRAAGRTSGEILAELERRLGHDDVTERAETVTALRDIALLRLEGLVA